MNNAVKKNIGFFIGPIGSAIIGFVTTPVITYFISPEEYGNVNMFQMIQTIIAVFIYLGLDQAYVRFFNHEQNKSKLWINSVFVPLFIGTIIAGILVLRSDFFARYILGSNERVLPIILLSVSIPLMVCERFILLWYRMSEKSYFYSLASIILKVSVLSVTILFFLYYEKSFYSAIYGSVLGQVIYDIVLIVVASLSMGKISASDISVNMIRKLMHYGLPLAPIDAISILLNSADRIAIKQFSTSLDLGVYGVALKITGVVGILKTCIVTFWTPLSFRWYSAKQDNRRYEIAIEIVTVLMILVCFAAYLIKPVVFMIFGGNYVQAQKIFPYLMFYPVLYTIAETFSVGILFEKKGKYITNISFLSLVIDLLFNVIFVPMSGAIGAAFATAVANTVYFFGIMVYSRNIWFKFSCKRIVFSVILLYIVATINTFFGGLFISLANCLAIFIIIIVFFPVLKNGFLLVNCNKGESI